MEGRIGLRTVPWGVPVFLFCLYEFPLLMEVYCTLAERKLLDPAASASKNYKICVSTLI